VAAIGIDLIPRFSLLIVKMGLQCAYSSLTTCSGLISSDRSMGGQSGIDEEKEQDDEKAPTI
jgi:hypothetical protein